MSEGSVCNKGLDSVPLVVFKFYVSKGGNHSLTKPPIIFLAPNLSRSLRYFCLGFIFLFDCKADILTNHRDCGMLVHFYILY